MSRLVHALLRAAALILLTALLVGVPILVVRVVGVSLPHFGEIGGAWSSRRVGNELVLQIGAAVFVLLWLWFVATALAEFRQVLVWRFGGSTTHLAPLPPGPSGWVRGLVRFIAVSSVTATATLGSIVPMVRSAAASAPVVAVATASPIVSNVDDSHVLRSGTTTHRAVGRETPYSLAGALGRPEVRDRIIALNLGRAGADGAVWQGGVFPAGMEVVLPEERAVLTPMGPAHEVVRGDSYWEIADDHLSVSLHRDPTPPEVLEYTNSLLSFNHELLGHREPTLIIPGELVVFVDSAVTSAPVSFDDLPIDVVPEPSQVDVDQESEAPAIPAGVPADMPARAVAELPAARPEAPAAASDSQATSPSAALSYAAGLGTALLLSAGALSVLEARRRRRLRSATVGARLTPPSIEQARTEVLLRSLDASERVARLDVALRSAAPDLAAQGASVLAAVLGDHGEVSLFVRGSATPHDAAWRLDLHANTWHLSAETSLRSLAERARQCSQPCPAMVHIGGVSAGGELFVDLEAVGTMSVRSPHSVSILCGIAASLAVSPFLEAARLFTVGLGEASLGSSSSESVESLDAALDAASMVLGSTALSARSATTFALRVAGARGEAWEPAVVVAAGQEMASSLAADLRSVAAGGRGLAVVHDAPIEAPEWRLEFDGEHHILEPLGLRVQPVGLSDIDVAAVDSLLKAADEVAVVHAPVVALGAAARAATPFVEPEWAVLVRVLGQVEVVSCDGVSADFERSKALELVVWLSQHRERPTRTAARTALWDLDVRDATFANVVSDARRAMARAIAPADGEEWMARTLTEELPLHERVVTDADLLSARSQHARGLATLDAIEVLRPGVELLAGMPFAGTNYLWTDAEGITSSLILLATGAAIELANHYLSLGDVEGVFWATGQGLKVLHGHEELIALRMRAHARVGDLSGVRSEWESYERALVADPWAAAEPAAKLVALRRELLASCRVATAEHA